jgi:hypothetical protein
VSELASESSGEAAAPGRTIPILLYHSVADRPSDFIAPHTVSPATFRRHLDAVAAAGATTLTVSCGVPERRTRC